MEFEGEKIDIPILKFNNKGLLCCEVCKRQSYFLYRRNSFNVLRVCLPAGHSFRPLGHNNEQNKDEGRLEAYILVMGMEGMQASPEE